MGHRGLIDKILFRAYLGAGGTLNFDDWIAAGSPPTPEGDEEERGGEDVSAPVGPAPGTPIGRGAGGNVFGAKLLGEQGVVQVRTDRAKSSIYQIHLDWSSGLVNRPDPKDIVGNGLTKAQGIEVSSLGRIRTTGGMVAHEKSGLSSHTAVIAPGYGLFIFNADYKSGTGVSAAAAPTGEQWLALADAFNSEIDLYDVAGASFAAAEIDMSTTDHSYTAPVNGDIDFTATNVINDSNSAWLTEEFAEGMIILVTASDNNTNIATVITAISENGANITVRGNPFTVDTSESGKVIITALSTPSFYYANNGLRVSDTVRSPITTTKVNKTARNYTYTKRTHFEDAAPTAPFSPDGWLDSVVSLTAPTNLGVDAVNGAAGAYPTTGVGLDIGIVTAIGGAWPASVVNYELALSFIYDETQESVLFVDSSSTFSITEGEKLTMTVRASSATEYNRRQSGARFYFREINTDEKWRLLADISMREGARSSISGKYKPWNNNTNDLVYTDNFISQAPTGETYESLSGLLSVEPRASMGGSNEGWVASTVMRNRTFLANVNYNQFQDDEIRVLRDSIFYSNGNAYDQISSLNFIEAAIGDAEDYIAIIGFKGRLLAFKRTILHIFDVSGDPTDYDLIQAFANLGVARPAAVFMTPQGPAWCNKFGVFIYNGVNVTPLLGKKVAISPTTLAHQGYYEFDGAGDYITKSNDANLNFGANTDFSLECWIRTTTDSADDLISKGSDSGTNKRYHVLVLSNGKIRAIIRSSSEVFTDSSSTINDGLWHYIVATYDRDGNLQIYIDGVADGSAVDISGQGDIDDTAEPLAIGIKSQDELSRPFDGDIALVRIWNRLLSSTEVALLAAGQPVAAVDQWGSQTDITPTGQAWSDSNTEGNSVGELTETLCSISSVTAAGETPAATHAGTWMVKMALAAGSSYCGDSFSTVIGKKYRASGWCYVPAGTGGFTQLRVGTSLNNNDLGAESYTTRDAWVYVQVEYTVTTTTTYISFLNGAPSGNMYVDDVVNVQIGAVAEYLPRNMTDATWTDESDNSLDGTVNGATFIYSDAWQSFYTDFSQLGYDPSLNQLIIMRDSLGTRSSGQDYQDAWIIDLDTGASTTSRRAFTNGFPFSNFALDWNQQLIIARQFDDSGTLKVAIERWSDTPVSKAVGLIDLRSRDEDFGNPFTNKVIDAVMITYKSAAAQTKPISYATNGGDLPTAWTRLTGNFVASTDWQTLAIELATSGDGLINAKSIRFRVDNPTTSTTYEFNDFAVRFREEPLKIS